MKKTIVLLASILMCMATSAERISRQQAMQKARLFMQANMPTARHMVPQATDGNGAEEYANYYVFNMEDNGGFVIVAGDERVTGVLGYAERGQLNEETMPCGLKAMLEYYDHAIGHLSSTYTAPRKTVHETIEPFVTTNWDQFNPYNDYCPMLNGRPAAAGCVAVAMAMAVNYTQWPTDSTAIVPGYTTTTEQIKMDTLPKKKFRWDNMDRPETAWLMSYCGQAIKTDYKNGASTAFNSAMPNALKKVFGYSQKLKLYYANGNGSQPAFTSEAWDSLIYGEISNRRAVIYNAFTANSEGHNFVVNGYTGGYYYINWGWRGDCNGYYSLDKFDAGGYNLDYNHSAVVNLRMPLPEDETAISHVSNDNATRQDFDVYTLTGVKIRTRATNLDGLPKGIYVVNGRKVVKN